MNSRPAKSVRWVAWFLTALLPATIPARGLEFRHISDGRIAQTGTMLPEGAVQVFLYAGGPHSVGVSGRYIAVSYGQCGVLFDRESGKMLEKLTIAQGWPEARPEAFTSNEGTAPRKRLIGPGIVPNGSPRRRGPKETGAPPKMEVAVSIVFGGLTWRAMQPSNFLRRIQEAGYKDRRGSLYTSWTGILSRLSKESYLEAVNEQGKSTRYTMADGLASNIVTCLLESQGVLWAVCVDIYDPDKQQWGAGGLSRFDPKTSKWERIEKINGFPVRWVTLLQSVGDELWVGFRKGQGVEGDRVNYGMGITTGLYRPKATAIVLARLSEGRWKTFSREVLPEAPAPFRGPREKESLHPPTEMPRKVARSGSRVFVFTGIKSQRYVFNFDYDLDGQVSLLDLTTGKWRIFDLYEDFDADYLGDMVAEGGEILVMSSRGVHEWDSRAGSWRFLDPKAELKNPAISAVISRGHELWVGYTNQSFGVIGGQGISVFDEKTLKWSYFSPEQIGTACPVRRLAVLPEGDVWALFQQRPELSAIMEFPYYARERKPRPPGLGCFSEQKWRYPIEIEAGRPRPESPSTMSGFFGPFPGRFFDLVAIDERLFVAAADGVYVGPEPWRRIVEGEIMRIAPSADRKTLKLLRRKESQTFERGQYNIATGKTTFETLPNERIEWWRMRPPTHVWDKDPWLESPSGRSWTGQWVRVRTQGEGDLAVGPLSNENHSVIETPYAVWIASRGELVRLDRRRLSQWLGQ